MGESGAGKSSLLRAILAVDRPQAGEVRLLGEGFSTAAGARLADFAATSRSSFKTLMTASIHAGGWNG